MNLCWLGLHRWGKWETYEFKRTKVYIGKTAEERQDVQEIFPRQQRRCAGCGLTQDKRMQEDM